MAKSKEAADAGNGKPVNKSEAVREALAQYPRATSKEIIAKLAERGVKVAPTLVYYVKSKQNHARRRERRARVAEESRRTAAGNPVELVLRGKDLAREGGGIKNLRLLVEP